MVKTAQTEAVNFAEIYLWLERRAEFLKQQKAAAAKQAQPTALLESEGNHGKSNEL